MKNKQIQILIKEEDKLITEMTSISITIDSVNSLVPNRDYETEANDLLRKLKIRYQSLNSTKKITQKSIKILQDRCPHKKYSNYGNCMNKCDECGHVEYD